ncbi:MAG: GPW/gp25 family protein [Gemmatimonadaceae bacterium]
MADPINVPDIRVADWQPALGEIGAIVEGLADIDQCIRTILLTPKGTLPHQPDFGSDVWRFLDWPIDQARPHLVRAVVEAVARWEPRVELMTVALEPDPAEPTTVLLQIGRRLRGTSVAPPPLVLEVAA